MNPPLADDDNNSYTSRAWQDILPPKVKMHRRLWNNDALWAVAGQLVFAIILSFAVGTYWGPRPAVSMFVGGMICVLPNISLYLRVFSHFGARKARKIVNAFYSGEAIKLLMTAVLFGVAFLVPAWLPLWILIGYIVAQWGFWLGPIVLSYWKCWKKSQ